MEIRQTCRESFAWFRRFFCPNSTREAEKIRFFAQKKNISFRIFLRTLKMQLWKPAENFSPKFRMVLSSWNVKKKSRKRFLRTRREQFSPHCRNFFVGSQQDFVRNPNVMKNCFYSTFSSVQGEINFHKTVRIFLRKVQIILPELRQWLKKLFFKTNYVSLEKRLVKKKNGYFFHQMVFP